MHHPHPTYPATRERTGCLFSLFTICIFAMLSALSAACSQTLPMVQRPTAWATDPSQWILKIPVNQWLILDPSLNEPLDTTAFQERLRGATVIFIGEQHDQTSHHRFEAWVLEQLVQIQGDDSPGVTLGVEMLRWPEQPIFDAYDRGEVTDAALRQEWSKSWGKDWSIYEPLIALAASPSVRLLALNAPKFLSRRVFEVGIEGLNEDERRYLPPALDDSNLTYRAFVTQALHAHASPHGGHKPHGDASSPNAEQNIQPDPEMQAAEQRFFHAQLVWDETMSHTLSQDIAQITEQSQPLPRYLAVAGGVHVMYGWGIPSRVAKAHPDLPQLLILCMSVDEQTDLTDLQKRLDPQSADLFCLTRSPHPDTRSAQGTPTTP